MSIAEFSAKGKLVIPDISECDTQQEMAWLYEEYGFPVHPWIRTRTKISARCGKGIFNSPEIIETYEDIALWARRWQVGFACSWRTGLIVLDIDDPAEFDDWAISHEVPETVRVATGREGGYHLYLDCRHLRSTIPLEEWPRQGDIPGGTLKTNGFVGAPGSRHPSGRQYRVMSDQRELARGSLELVHLLAEYRSKRAPSALETSPGYVGELLGRALAAREGEQHEAVLMLLNALEREASREAINGSVLPLLVRALPSYDSRNPWSLDGLREMLGSSQTIVTTAEEERLLAEIAVMTPNVAGEEGEDWFWNSREDLTTIRQWAQAQMIGPWALLAEILTEVIARVPPTFVLPRIVAGYGTLNMLMAVTGNPAAGKGGAASVAEDALAIDENSGPDGKPFNPGMKPERIPVGSGEGLAKNYGYYSSRDGGLIRQAYTSIITAYEIDTMRALMERGSATLSAELRKLYSGEQLGFGYGDLSKRIIIPRYGYRGVLIANVQPERAGGIVHDQSSGFAQRWMFLDAIDHWAPEVIPPRPEPIKWTLPRGLWELDHEAGKPLEIMDVCQSAVDEIIEARREGVRGRGDRLRGHTLYTQEKFAAALALLAMRTAITEEDWKLAAYAIERSDAIRALCLSELRKQTYREARNEGRKEGVKAAAAEDMKGKESDRKLWQLILKHVPAEGRISRGALGKKMPARRDDLPGALKDMVRTGILVVERGEYQGRPAEWYSKKKRG
jgi:Bifunctional DNA primase/polymerase, N-terminal